MIPGFPLGVNSRAGPSGARIHTHGRDAGTSRYPSTSNSTPNRSP